MSIKKWLKSVIVGTALCSMMPTFGVTIDKIIVFGDSLSDNGNVYNMLATARNVIPLVPLIPKNPPYFEGRFTNGYVWIEHVSKSLNVPLVNYAYGGAWVEGFFDSMQILPPSLGMQVDMYSVAPSTIIDFKMHQHLYVIWAGNNDYLKGRTNPDYATTNTVDTLSSQIDWLVRMGAKHFIVLNLPDLSRTPTAMLQGPNFAVALQKMVDQHNAKLTNRLNKLQKDHPDVDIIYVDIMSDFYDLINNPSKYGFKSVDKACYNGDFMFAARQFAHDPGIEAAKEAKFEVANNSVLMDAYVNSLAATRGYRPCHNPDEFLFWDKTHPTRIAHQLLGLSVSLKLAEFGIVGR